MAELSSSIRVLIADDHQLVRQGIQALLMVAKDIEIVGQARDGVETIKLTQELQPDVILMDIEMPIMDGLKATRQLVAAGSESRVLILSMHEDEEAVRQSVQAGAWGYELKNSSRDELIAAIRSIRQGLRVASPAVAAFFADSKAPAE